MIILYGGTFDPLHVGHLVVANEVYDAFRPDRFVFMPAAQSPLKSRHAVATDNERVKMLELGIDELGFGEVSTFELERNGQSYTYDTVKYLSKTDSDIFVVIGSDQYDQLNNWYRIDELHQMCTFLVVNRSVEYQQVEEARSFHIPRIDVSSTEIRTRLAAGKTVKFWLTEDIETYVRKERIYEEEKSD